MTLLDRLATTLHVPPAWVGYRGLRHVSIRDYFLSHRGSSDAGRYQTVHPPAVARHPLPGNVGSREDLPATRGWWGFSFRDVPERLSGETALATLPDCRITWYRDASRGHDFYPAILTRDGTALQMRELRFRQGHARALRRAPEPVTLDRATWIIERVYHNHSHWLTAHLPKLLLLRSLGQLRHVLLPRDRTPAMDASMRLVGIDPGGLRTFDPERPLCVRSLTVLDTDRFRPDLLQLVPRAMREPPVRAGWRRIYISRAGASRRRLVNEEDLWPVLRAAGFERVQMESLDFEQQVHLMREAAVVLAPHGAGLTNILFCPAPAQIVEIADLGFPNPNFYALASALGHHYWVVNAESLGDGHPLARDLRVDPDAVAAVLPAVLDQATR